MNDKPPNKDDNFGGGAAKSSILGNPPNPRTDEVKGPLEYAKAGDAKKLHKANVQKWLAYSLIAVFAAEILLAFCAFMFFSKPVMEIKEMLLEVIGPTSALVGSIFGFYFGSFGSKDD